MIESTTVYHELSQMEETSACTLPNLIVPEPPKPVGDLSIFFAAPIPLWKRTIDIAGAFMGLLCLLPVLIAIAVLIKSVSRGPVFFTQKRVGYKGKVFTCLKFRTMEVDSDIGFHRDYMSQLIKNLNIPMNKLEQNNNIIKCGKFLRNTCLDELPQLINVLHGKMSLVGPRPCLLYEAELYDQWHVNRFDSVPGLTGLWQISGKNETSFEEMIRLDKRYISTMSFYNDCRIIFLTIPSLIRNRSRKKRRNQN